MGWAAVGLNCYWRNREMGTLIMVILGVFIALFGSLATIYYAAPLSRHADLKARATGVITQGQQIRSAAVLYYNRTGAAPGAVADLIKTSYLTNISKGWKLATVSGSPTLYAENTGISRAVCLKADQLLDSAVTSVPSCSSSNAAQTICCQ